MSEIDVVRARCRLRAREIADRDVGMARAGSERRHADCSVVVSTDVQPQRLCTDSSVQASGRSCGCCVPANGRIEPVSFDEQPALIWQHLRAILRSAGMDVHNLVSLRTYLADPADDEANVRMRVKHLGQHEPALTEVCCRLLEPRWRLEVEAVAAA